jgi:ABC transport system ATP-binding/permease protein
MASFTLNDDLAQQNALDLRLDAAFLTRRVGNQILLDEVSLTILPKEFVAIAGVSGAGKTTLMDALSGFRPANRGHVFVNYEDLYLHYDRYRAQLGYVPQDDIIHQELTVYQALDFSAQLRLPATLSPKDRHHRIQSVLSDLELTHRQHALVKNLSGGQRKRVSIGVELLTQPSLFFLDEATSGLDPGTELQMMKLLRRLADGGRTILLNTHTTKNVMLCDMVVFLARGGKVAYYGPPQDALVYFGVKDFDEIYVKVEEERSPQDWQQQYRESLAYQKYVSDRQTTLTDDREPSGRRSHAPRDRGSSAWRQFRLLSRRNLTILIQDRASLLLMLMVAPILGLLDLVMVRRNVFDATLGDSGQSLTLMFLAGLIAVLVGSLATMREIVKEAEIYRRERMVGLRVWPYLLSKVWLCIVIAAYQSAIFWTTKIYLVDLPHNDFNTRLAMYFTLFLSTLAGLIMGLLISALSTAQNAAPLLTILFLVPQITLAGAIFPLNALGPTGDFMSRFTVTRWSYEAMVTLSGLGKDVAQDTCWQQPDSVRKGWSESQKANCRCLGPHIFDRCYFPGLKKEYDPIVNQPQPTKPKDLRDPPAAPDNLLGPETQTFLDDLKTYKNQVETYRTAIDRWQDRLARWKEKRGTAIASGEALVTRVRRTQGSSFSVNVPQHWGILAAIQAGMLGLLFVVQRRKDVL